jgi:hypothetical protein
MKLQTQEQHDKQDASAGGKASHAAPECKTTTKEIRRQEKIYIKKIDVHVDAYHGQGRKRRGKKKR